MVLGSLGSVLVSSVFCLVVVRVFRVWLSVRFMSRLLDGRWCSMLMDVSRFCMVFVWLIGVIRVVCISIVFVNIML